MRRKEIEEKIFGLSRGVQEKVESSPFPAVVIAFVAGIVFAAVWQSILLLLLVAGVVVFALWFLAEESAAPTFDTTPSEATSSPAPAPTINGADHSSLNHGTSGDQPKP